MVNKKTYLQSEICESRLYLYGLKDLQKFLGIGITSASKLTNSVLIGTWYRTGRKLIYRADEVVTKLKEQNK